MAEENNAQNASGNQSDVPKGTQFALQRIYLKDMSFESPQGPAAVQKQWQPKIGQDLNTSAKKLADNSYEVVLKLTVKAAVEDKTAFLVEVHQAGLFHIGDAPESQLAQIFNTVCAQILFPYARESIDNAVVRGGFPALHLPPINFDALFAQAVKEARNKPENAKADASATQ